MRFTVLRSKAIHVGSKKHPLLTISLPHVNGQFKIQCFSFRTQVHCFSGFYGLKTWLKLPRVKLYRNELRGNKKHCERFELSRVRFTEGKIIVNVWGNSRGNRFWFEVAQGEVCEGSSDREWSVSFSRRYLKILVKGAKKWRHQWNQTCLLLPDFC